jgi:hypothetical protein
MVRADKLMYLFRFENNNKKHFEMLYAKYVVGSLKNLSTDGTNFQFPLMMLHTVYCVRVISTINQK